ncbi:polysaccharide pyruvyl transferase family protein [Candidatus Peregrinibacteria bacterium]|nr:polysaccharide pyruvyl transferase family protein [Candidatus Peregrinibacteria bacterium]
MKTVKIVIAGNYGAKNLGDELILSGLLQSVENAVGKNCKITVLSANPLQTSKLHHVDSVRQFPAGIRSFFRKSKETEKAVRECDFFILGGGGLFLSLSFYANFIWAIQAYHAYKLGKKVLMCGQSIGKTGNPILKFMIKRLFNKATLITVRDSGSRENLKNLGITKKIHMAPDFAFQNLEPIPGARPAKRGHSSSSPPPYALVALRQMPSLKKSFYKHIADFLIYLRDKENLAVKLVNFQTGHEADSIIHQKVLSHIKDQKSIELIPDISDPSELFPLFSNAKFALCMRLHSVITAIKCETPFTAINYAVKVTATLKDLKLVKNSLNLANISFANLKRSYETSKRSATNCAATAQKELEKFAKTTLRNVLTA